MESLGPVLCKAKEKIGELTEDHLKLQKKKEKKYPKNKESLQTWWRNPQANGCVIEAEEQSRDESGKLKQQ